MKLFERQIVRFLDRFVAGFEARRGGAPFKPFAIELWNGHRAQAGEEPGVVLKVRSQAAALHLLRPSLGRLGQAYVDGQLDVDGPIGDVIEVAESIASNVASLPRRGALPRAWKGRHSKSSDQSAIQYHYDVSNDFYARWLDEAMVYSCAYFRTGTESLEQAQSDKLELIMRKLRIAPGHRLLDVGCGWGALVIHAARHHGARAVGITLSQRQHDLATERVRAAGLAGQVEIRLQDYRDVRDGPFDRITSVGMFEHVGLANLQAYFRILRDLLADDGVVLNHGITSSDPDSRSVGRGVSEFIERYVFPDGELPHVSLAIREMAAAGLEVVDAESLRRHYAMTCRHWSARFENARSALSATIDERKLRIWRVYLAACVMGFERSWINLYQLLGVRSGAAAAALPLTRDDIYLPRPGA
ncbi:MAG: class I SAM-dependent methyltransferase [Lautropia sp.]